MDLLKTRIVEDISALGALPFFIAIIVACWLLGFDILALQVLVGVVIAFAITYAIRAAYHKERPRPQAYKTHLERIDASSFPSMHSMRAAMLFVLASVWFNSSMASVALGCYAMGVMMSRYGLKRHDAVDIVGGFVIGLLIGVTILLLTSFV